MYRLRCGHKTPIDVRQLLSRITRSAFCREGWYFADIAAFDFVETSSLDDSDGYTRSLCQSFRDRETTRTSSDDLMRASFNQHMHRVAILTPIAQKIRS